jgi:hypothetical protein
MLTIFSYDRFFVVSYLDDSDLVDMYLLTILQDSYLVFSSN